MFTGEFEPLGLEDNILLARINLGSAAVSLLVFAVFAGSWGWPVQALFLVAAAAVTLLVSEIGPMLRRLDTPHKAFRQNRAPEFYFTLH